jgi:hypothetical protein
MVDSCPAVLVYTSTSILVYTEVTHRLTRIRYMVCNDDVEVTVTVNVPHFYGGCHQ